MIKENNKAMSMRSTLTLRVTPHWLLVTMALCAIVLLGEAWGAGSAHAAFGVSFFGGSLRNPDGSEQLQAGAHPDVTTSIRFTKTTIEGGREAPDGNAKDIEVSLPPGLIGNPLAAPKCTQQELEGDGYAPECPVNTQVGVVTITTYFFGGFASRFAVYNMEAPPGVPGQFAANVDSALVFIDARVRSGNDYGITADIADISQTLALGDTSLTLWGVPADPSHDAERFNAKTFTWGLPSTAPLKPMMTNPTSCGGNPLSTTLHTDSWQEPGVFHPAGFDEDESGTPIAISGCERLPFEPKVTVAPSSRQAGAPTGLEVKLSIPQSEDPDGLASADLKRAVVTLPEGMSVNPSSADGLGACEPGEIALDSASSPSCPDASKIGSVVIDTPLLEAPMEGSVYLAKQGNNPFGSLLAVYLVASGPGVVIKLPGEIAADPNTGRLTATFDNAPQLPFSTLVVRFKGGPRAPLSNPSSCGTKTASAELTAWSGEVSSQSDSFQVSEDGHGAPCPARGFAPGFVAGTSNPVAGAASPFEVQFARTDADQELGKIRVLAPEGLLGVLKSVPLCPEPQATQGACGAGSLIGHTTVGAGAGSIPFYLGGNVYLTGPYNGAPFGLSIVVPAIAGPFNLGTVVVRAAIAVDPSTAALTITSDPLPTILQGIPLQIRSVNVTVDRAGFMFNPTRCSPLVVAATIGSTQGASAAISSRFQVTGCASLAFKPKFSASVAGKSSRASGVALDVKIASGAGQANIGRVAVSLPKALPSRLSTIQKACPEATFAANPDACPAGSLVGTGRAVTPILAQPLTGSAYLVSHGGAAFPDLVVVLEGRGEAAGVRVDLTGAINISKAGVTSSTFANVPDVPISSFELKLPTGPHSALTGNLPAKAKGSFCGQALTMPTALTGQNGVQVKQSTKIAVTGCLSKKAKQASVNRRAYGSVAGR